MLPGSVLLAGWAVSAWLYSSLDRDRIRQDEDRVDKIVSSVEARISGSFYAYEDVLRGGAGLLTASGRISPRDWHIYVSRLGLLERYPGTAVISVVQPVPKSRLNRFVQAQRKQEWPDFRVRSELGPYSSNASASEYFLIVCAEPPRVAAQAVGSDVSADVRRKAAADKARDSGQAVLTRSTILVRGSGKALQLFVPVYRNGASLATVAERRDSLIAWVTIVLSADTFFHSALASLDTTIGLRAYDGDQAVSSNLLFSSGKAVLPGRQFERTTRMVLGGNWWTLGWNRLQDFPSTSKTPSAWAAGCTALVSVLLAGVVMSLQTSGRQATDRLKLIQSGLALGTWEIDINRRTVRCSEQFLRLYGVQESRERLDLDEWLSRVHQDDREREIIQVYPGKDAHEPIDRQYRVAWPDGSVHWLHSKAVAVFDYQNRPTHLIGVDFDITERKRAEQEHEKMQGQLMQAQKMESIGRMAGGIAHDFNNLLTVINGYAGQILKRMHATDPLRRQILEIQNGGRRAAGMVQQLLAFSRKQVLHRESTDLNAVIHNVESMLCRVLGEDIEIITQLKPSLQPVLVDRNQIERVIINLALNARDAMPRGGTLFIQTDEALLENSCARCLAETRPGRYVQLVVRDTGSGMSGETKQHLFEPFFTTKEVDKGTGLGLATVHGIVLQSGGHIDVLSEPGEGAAFYICLPASGTQPEPEGKPISAEPALGTGTVLVVEDQDALRELVAGFLEEHGYRVVKAAGGDEALAVCAVRAFDLLLTDVVMPRMSGTELAANVRSHQPSMKVLYMSGYSDEVLAGRVDRINDADLIQKPFALDELAAKVREVLSRT